MTNAFMIHNEADYDRALALIDELWEAAPGTDAADVLDIMATLVEQYEKRHHRPMLPASDPRDLIRFKLTELGWSQNDLAKRVGCTSGRISEFLSGRRPLTLRVIQQVSSALGLPAGLLVHDSRLDEADHVWVRLTAAQASHLTACVTHGAALEDVVRGLLDHALGLRTTSTSANGTLLMGVAHLSMQPANNTAYSPCVEAA